MIDNKWVVQVNMLINLICWKLFKGVASVRIFEMMIFYRKQVEVERLGAKHAKSVWRC